MDIEILKAVTINAKYANIHAYVRYWEDGSINGKEDDNDNPSMPFADDDFWCPVIDLDNGKIVDWPSGITASIQYKVCDECEIDCVDDEGNVICTNDNNYYVPDFLCPKEKGYGDYIIMEVDENGFIKEYNKKDVVNWIKNQTKTNNIKNI